MLLIFCSGGTGLVIMGAILDFNVFEKMNWVYIGRNVLRILGDLWTSFLT